MCELERSDDSLEVEDVLTLSTDEIIAISEIETLLAPTYEFASLSAVVAGYIGLEVGLPLLNGSPTLTPGQWIETGKARLLPCGPVANIGLALHSLGITTRLMGKIGSDIFGQALLRLISAQEESLVQGMVCSAEEASAYTIALEQADNERIQLQFPGCSTTFGLDDISYALLETAGLFHLANLALLPRLYQQQGAEAVQLLRRAKALGTTTSLDLSLPRVDSPAAQIDWLAVLTALLPSVDIVLPGIEEALYMLRRPLFDKLKAKAGKGKLVDLVSPDLISELAGQLLDMGAKIVVLKLGRRGLYLRTGNMDLLGRELASKVLNWGQHELWAPCFSVQPVNTRGAGDATIAGLLMSILRGMGPEASLSAACAIGACSIERTEAIRGLKNWPAIMERIAAGWPRLLPEKKGRAILDPAAARWRWDERYELWVGPHDHRY